MSAWCYEMSDLIDLDTSDEKVKTTSLVEPLIPAPVTLPNERQSLVGNQDNDSRLSLDNNPFDQVLKETTKNIRKMQDPFEMVLEKAFKCKSQNTTPTSTKRSEKHSKKNRLSDLFKMNKSVDEPMMKGSYISDRNEINTTFSKPIDQKFPEISIRPPSPQNLSILNESAMNDTLLENIIDSGNNENQQMINCNDNNGSDLLKLRSYSQTDQQLSPQIFRKPRSHSVVETRYRSCSDVSTPSSIASIFFNDNFNKAFCKSYLSNTSGTSNISSISSISRINSTFSSTNSSDVLNKAFVNSTLSQSISGNKSSDMSDLIKKFQEIKSRLSINSSSNSDIFNNVIKENNVHKSVSDTNIPNSINNELKKEEKLIDVDDFVLQKEMTSFSDSSSDSVFIENVDKQEVSNKAIFKEAKTLSKTLQEMAELSSSSASMEDLASSKPPWNFDILPQSDDETTVDNLIELPNSPTSSNTRDFEQKDDERTSQRIIERSSSFVNELEADVGGLKDPKKKQAALTLLLELRNLVNAENKPEATKLLADLENILGINSENNTELLTMCLQNSNKSESANDIENMITDSTNDAILKDNDEITGNIEKEKEDDKREKPKAEENIAMEDKKDIEQNAEDTKVSEEEKNAANLLGNLEKILQESPIESGTFNLLKQLGVILSKLSEPKNIQKNEKSSETQKNEKSSETQKNVEKQETVTEVQQQETKTKHVGRNSLGSLSKTNSVSVNSTSMEKSNKKIEPLSRSFEVNKQKQTEHGKTKSRLSDANKRFSSDSTLDSILSKKRTHKVFLQKQDIKGKPDLIPDVHKGKPVTDIVKSKLKRRNESDPTTKKGPLKAILPLSNMQKQNKNLSSSSKRIDSVDELTSPKGSVNLLPFNSISSSTPKSPLIHKKKKTVKSSPIASSTPSDKKMETKKSNESIDTSSMFSNSITVVPYTTTDNEKSNSSAENRHILKTPSPKKRSSTTKVRRSQSASNSMLPRYSPRPNVNRQRNPHGDMRQRGSVSPQPVPAKVQAPSSEKILERRSVMSPLKVNNQSLQIKTFPVISKYRKGSDNDDIAEKENHYV